MSQVSMRTVAQLGELRLPDHLTEREELFLDTVVGGMAIDSREVEGADVFFALKGARADGHDYVAIAQDNGAVAAIVERFVESDLPQVRVDSADTALGHLGKSFRQTLGGKVIGITGSAGKTSVKNLVRALLQQFGTVSATQGNLNNELGVPLTLARAPASTDYVVVEMGAAQRGDIAYLVDIALPTIALVNNVGSAHVGRFGGIEITASTKGEIYSRLLATDTAIVNLDGDYAKDYLEQYCSGDKAPRALTFSRENASANVYASNVVLDVNGFASFELHFDLENLGRSQFGPLTSPAPGLHGLANLLAAISIAIACDCAPGSVVNAIQSLDQANAALSESGRMVVRHQGARLRLIDDSYNASPDAVRVAIDHLATTQRYHGSTRVIVLGDMAELGDDAPSYHRDLGAYAAGQGVNQLLAVGEFAEDYAAGFNAAAGNAESGGARVFESREALTAAFIEIASAGQPITALVKGSRAAKMDLVVDAVMQSDALRGDRC